jgi:VWFA-related protein
MRSHVPALTAAVITALGVSLASQQAPPVFRSKANLVRLHVVVRDAQGRPVHGLTKADFQIRDSKDPRAIDVFEEVSRPDDDQPALVPVGFPLDVADNRVAKASRLVVIVLDDMVIRPMLEKTKALARATVSRLGDDAVMAYVTTSGMDGVEATADHSAILRAINRVGTSASKAPRIPERFGSYTSQATLAEQLLLHENGCHTAMLSQAARMVAGPQSTRRIFVYIGPYCSANLFDDELLNNREADRVRYLYETLRQSDVTVYGLDPRGEMGYSLAHFASEDITGASPPPSRAMTRSWNPVVDSQGALQDLAMKTGGFAVTNSNAFEEGFAQIEDDLNQYYVLGFYDVDTKPNRYHAVDVTMSNPGLTVRFRPGYFSGRLETKEDKDPMVRLSAGAIPSSELPLRLFTVTEPRGGNTRVNLVLEVGWTGLEKPDATGQWQESLDALVLVGKVMSGKIEKKWAVKRPVAVPVSTTGPRGFAAYQAVMQVELSPGNYQFRVSAKSATGKTGSVYYAVEIPKNAPVAMGDILVGAPDRISPIVAASPKGIAALPFAVTLDRVFTQAERLRFFAKVFQSASNAPPKGKLDFVDTAGKVVHSVEVGMPPGSQALDATVALSPLAPGAYRARLSTDGASREVSLVIRQ